MRGVSIPNLPALREARGLTRRELAHLTGLSHDTIIRLETGRRLASIRVLLRLAPALGMSFDELLRHTDLEERPASW